MPKNFVVYMDGVCEVTVEAESLEEAKEKALVAPNKDWHDASIYKVEDADTGEELESA